MNKDKRNLRGAVVAVTGAGTGVGAAACRLFAENGARLLLMGRGEDKLRQTQKQLPNAKTEVEICAGDVGESDFCERALDAAVARFGSLDIVVNNAGQIHRGLAQDTPDEQWRRIMRVNLDGVFWMCRAARRRMQNGGAIVNVASTAGLVGVAGLASYCASKGGVVQLTRALALEFADANISVNAICPGAIESPMLFSEHPPTRTDDQTRATNKEQIPSGRLATAEETARAILFLSTEPHITGASLSIDGGYTAR